MLRDEYFLKTPNSRLLGNRIGRGISSMFQRISPVSFNASTPQDNRHEAGKRKKNIETSPPCTLNQAKKLDGDNTVEESPILKNNEHLQVNLINHNSSDICRLPWPKPWSDILRGAHRPN